LFCYYVCLCAILPAKAVPEMTYTVSGGTLYSTHLLTFAEYAAEHDGKILIASVEVCIVWVPFKSCMWTWCVVGGREESGGREDTDGEHHKGQPTDAAISRQTRRLQSQTKVAWYLTYTFFGDCNRGIEFLILGFGIDRNLQSQDLVIRIIRLTDWLLFWYSS